MNWPEGHSGFVHFSGGMLYCLQNAATWSTGSWLRRRRPNSASASATNEAGATTRSENPRRQADMHSRTDVVLRAPGCSDMHSARQPAVRVQHVTSRVHIWHIVARTERGDGADGRNVDHVVGAVVGGQ